MLAGRERLEGGVKCGRRKRDERDEENATEEDAVVDRSLPEAHPREDRPVGEQKRGVDELQQMAAAPEELVARPREAALVGKQNPGDAETRQRQYVDQSAERHRDRERRRRREPSRKIDQEADDSCENAQRQSQKSDVIGRMENERDVIVERRLGRLEKGGREQARKSDEDSALPDPPERRGAHVVAGELQRRDGDKEGEHALKPDHQREDDVDDEALVEEVDRPEGRLLHPRNPGQRQQYREHAGERERPDGEPRPAEKLAPYRAPRAGRGARAAEDRCLRRFGHRAVNCRPSDRGGPP